jgi:hypothetical protein
MNSTESISLIERFLGYENVSDFWSDFEQTQRIQKRLRELDFPFMLNKIWIEDEDMWLYENYEKEKIIL